MPENNIEGENQGLDFKTANIMLAGKTGAGKSTLLNAIFGKELAATGVGRPITDHIGEYSHESIPIHIWDTVGLELGEETTPKSIDEIKNTITSRLGTKDKSDLIHAIWYCVNSQNNRYESAELDFIKDLHSLEVPFIIVMTQCYGDKKKIAEFKEIINKINQEKGWNDIPVISVLAEDYEVEWGGEVHPIPSFGLEELVNITMDQLPEFVERSFIAAQMVSESEKHVQSEKDIWTYVNNVKNNNKIINFDKIPVINFLTTSSHIKKLFGSIAKNYNSLISNDELNELIKELGGLSPENAVQGLLSPVSEEFDKKVEKIYFDNAKGDYNEDFLKLSKKERVARMLVLFGYTFLAEIEKHWRKERSKIIEGMEVNLEELKNNVKRAFKELLKERD